PPTGAPEAAAARYHRVDVLLGQAVRLASWGPSVGRARARGRARGTALDGALPEGPVTAREPRAPLARTRRKPQPARAQGAAQARCALLLAAAPGESGRAGVDRRSRRGRLRHPELERPDPRRDPQRRRPPRGGAPPAVHRLPAAAPRRLGRMPEPRWDELRAE